MRRREPLPNHNIYASPAEEVIRALPGENYLLSEVAEMVGVSPNTLRRLIRSDPPRVKAPTYVVPVGKMNIYCFTPRDVREVRKFYEQKYEDFPGPGQRLNRGRPRARKPANEASKKSA